MLRGFGPEPVLRNVHWREIPFAAGCTFSPIGGTLLVPAEPVS